MSDARLTDIRPKSFPWLDYRSFTFSLGLTDGHRSWLSGHTASENEPSSSRIVLAGGIEEQCRTVWNKIECILEGADQRLDEITWIIEYVPVDRWDSRHVVEAVRRERLGSHEPIVVTLMIDRLLRADAAIEIEVTVMAGSEAELLGLPMIRPIDSAGEVRFAGDARSQYDYCLDLLAESLSSRGLNMECVAKLNEIVSVEHAGSREITALRESRWNHEVPALSQMGMSVAQDPGCAVAVCATACTTPPVVRGELAETGFGGAPTHVSAAGLVFFSTITAPPGIQQDVLKGDLVRQADLVYDVLTSRLDQAGAGVELVRTTELVTQDALATYREIGAVRRRTLNEPWPASTGLVVGRLGDAGATIALDSIGTIS